MKTAFIPMSDESLHRLSRRPSLSVPHLAHDVIDQLSIIKLSCFKISHTFSIDPKKKPTKDFEAIDNAVREITMLIEKFSNCLQNPKRPGRAIAVTHKHPSNPICYRQVEDSRNPRKSVSFLNRSCPRRHAGKDRRDCVARP